MHQDYICVHCIYQVLLGNRPKHPPPLCNASLSAVLYLCGCMQVVFVCIKIVFVCIKLIVVCIQIVFIKCYQLRKRFIIKRKTNFTNVILGPFFPPTYLKIVAHFATYGRKIGFFVLTSRYVGVRAKLTKQSRSHIHLFYFFEPYSYIYVKLTFIFFSLSLFAFVYANFLPISTLFAQLEFCSYLLYSCS